MGRMSPHSSGGGSAVILPDTIAFSFQDSSGNVLAILEACIQKKLPLCRFPWRRCDLGVPVLTYRR